MPPLTLGQTLYYVPSRRFGDPHDVAVTKIGRKWATISNGDRIALDTWRADGGAYSSPGRCYASREQYDAKCLRESAWQELSREMRNACSTPPDSVTTEAILQARALLGFE